MRAGLSRPAILGLALMLLAAYATPALAQPGAGSSFDYKITIEIRVNGTEPGGSSYSGVIECTAQAHVVVSSVEGGEITFTSNVSRLNCASRGDLGPFSTLTQGLAFEESAGLVGNKTLPVDQGFDPNNPEIYVNPDKLPDDGEYKNETVHLVYDKHTGMIRYAEIRSVTTVQFASLSTIETLVKLEMVSSNVKGGHSLAAATIAGVIVVVAAAAAFLALRVLKGPSAPAA